MLNELYSTSKQAQLLLAFVSRAVRTAGCCQGREIEQHPLEVANVLNFEASIGQKFVRYCFQGNLSSHRSS